MVFSAVTFLYLLPLAGLPIVFHLALKLKKRTVVFPTLMFFYRVDPRLNSRRRIQNWLLLLLRVFLIGLLLLTLSRPVIRGAGGHGGKLSLVLVLDNSGSMTGTARGEDMTKLECASEGARRLVSSLDEKAEAGIVLMVEDPAVTVPETLTTDRAALLGCLDQVGPTEATGDAQRALAQAIQLLRGGTAGCGAVHVFTDLQAVEWKETATRLEVDGDDIDVYLHRISTEARERANVAVTGIQLPEQRLLSGQPYSVGLSLRNGSDLPAEVRVNRVDCRSEKGTENVMLQPHQVTTVALPVTPDEQGFHWVRVWIEGDTFAADNAAGLGLWCEGVGTAVFLGGPHQFGMLPLALSPLGTGQLSGLRTEFSESGRFEPEASDTAPMLVVGTWSSLQADGGDGGTLARYLEEGGCLLVVPSATSGSQAPPASLPAWLGGGRQRRQSYAAGARLELLNRDGRFWRDINRVVGDISAQQVVAYTACPLDLPSSYTALLATAGDKVVLAERAIGEGSVFVSGTAFSPRWNTLPLSGLGVVMTQRMAAMCRVGNGRMTEILTAGRRPRIDAGASDAEILSFAGDALEWKGQGHEAPVLPRTGVYLLTTGAEKRCLSVQASPREGEDRFMEVPDASLMGDVRHTVVAFDMEADYRKYHAAQAKAAELYIPLLLLAVLLAVLEGLIGAPRRRRVGKERAARPTFGILGRKAVERVDSGSETELSGVAVTGGRGP